jgi:hypothetical protein
VPRSSPCPVARWRSRRRSCCASPAVWTAGARGTLLKATALNDYEVSLPFEDATRHGAFLATRLDGQLLRVRDRGPLWILYPWSSRQELNTATYRERSIWQLRQIEVV